MVVVGVLLALWAQEWVSDRGQHKADALAEAAVRAELLDNIGNLAAWQSMDNCYTEQLIYLRDRLLASDGNWPGVDRRAIYEQSNEGRIFPGFYTLWSNSLEDKAWQSAIRSGAADRMGEDRRAGYASLYSQFRRYGAQMDRAVEARQQIGALLFPGRISDDRRMDMLNQLSALDSSREYMARDRSPSSFRLTADERAEITKSLGTRKAQLETLGTVRACYKEPRIPEFIGQDS